MKLQRHRDADNNLWWVVQKLKCRGERKPQIALNVAEIETELMWSDMRANKSHVDGTNNNLKAILSY